MTEWKPECPVRTWVASVDPPSCTNLSEYIQIWVRRIPTSLHMGPLYAVHTESDCNYDFYFPAIKATDTPRGLHPLFLRDDAWTMFCSQTRMFSRNQVYIPDIQFYTADANYFTDMVLLHIVQKHVAHRSFLTLARANSLTEKIEVLREFNCSSLKFYATARLLWVDPCITPSYIVLMGGVCGMNDRHDLMTLYDEKPDRIWSCIPADWRVHVTHVTPSLTKQRLFMSRSDPDSNSFLIAFADIVDDRTCTPWTCVFKRSNLVGQRLTLLHASPVSDVFMIKAAPNTSVWETLLEEEAETYFVLHLPGKTMQILPRDFESANVDLFGHIHCIDIAQRAVRGKSFLLYHSVAVLS